MRQLLTLACYNATAINQTCDAMFFKQLAIQLVGTVAVLFQPKKNTIRRPVRQLAHTERTLNFG